MDALHDWSESGEDRHVLAIFSEGEDIADQKCALVMPPKEVVCDALVGAMRVNINFCEAVLKATKTFSDSYSTEAKA